MREWNDADDSSKWSRLALRNLCAANGWRAFAVHTSNIDDLGHEFTTSAGWLVSVKLPLPPVVVKEV